MGLRLRDLHNGFLLLQHEPALPRWHLSLELGERVAAAAADVDEGRGGAGAVELEILDQAILDRVKAFVHEIGPVFAHAGQVGLQHPRVLSQPYPVAGRLVCILK